MICDYWEDIFVKINQLKVSSFQTFHFVLHFTIKSITSNLIKEIFKLKVVRGGKVLKLIYFDVSLVL